MTKKLSSVLAVLCFACFYLMQMDISLASDQPSSTQLTQSESIQKEEKSVKAKQPTAKKVIKAKTIYHPRKHRPHINYSKLSKPFKDFKLSKKGQKPKVKTVPPPAEPTLTSATKHASPTTTAKAKPSHTAKQPEQQANAKQTQRFNPFKKFKFTHRTHHPKADAKPTLIAAKTTASAPAAKPKAMAIKPQQEKSFKHFKFSRRTHHPKSEAKPALNAAKTTTPTPAAKPKVIAKRTPHESPFKNFRFSRRTHHPKADTKPTLTAVKTPAPAPAAKPKAMAKKPKQEKSFKHFKFSRRTHTPKPETKPTLVAANTTAPSPAAKPKAIAKKPQQEKSFKHFKFSRRTHPPKLETKPTLVAAKTPAPAPTAKPKTIAKKPQQEKSFKHFKFSRRTHHPKADAKPTLIAANTLAAAPTPKQITPTINAKATPAQPKAIAKAISTQHIEHQASTKNIQRPQRHFKFSRRIKKPESTLKNQQSKNKQNVQQAKTKRNWFSKRSAALQGHPKPKLEPKLIPIRHARAPSKLLTVKTLSEKTLAEDAAVSKPLPKTKHPIAKFYRSLYKMGWLFEGSYQSPHHAYTVINPHCKADKTFLNNAEKLIAKKDLAMRWVVVDCDCDLPLKTCSDLFLAEYDFSQTPILMYVDTKRKLHVSQGITSKMDLQNHVKRMTRFKRHRPPMHSQRTLNPCLTTRNLHHPERMMRHGASCRLEDLVG